MTRRRMRNAWIYRRWSTKRQLRWFPPYGWVTKAQALQLFYTAGVPDLARAAAYYMGFDPGAPGGDMMAVTVREGDKRERK